MPLVACGTTGRGAHYMNGNIASDKEWVMGFPKTLIALAAVSSLVATPAFAGVQSLSLASQPAAANARSAKDVRATTKMRKSGKLAEGAVLGVAAAVAAGLGIAAAAGAFDDNGDSN